MPLSKEREAEIRKCTTSLTHWRIFDVDPMQRIGSTFDVARDLLAALDESRALVPKFRDFMVRVKAANEICRCAPNYRCMRCSANDLLEKSE